MTSNSTGFWVTHCSAVPTPVTRTVNTPIFSIADGAIAYHTRLPFFDRDLIELTLAIPVRYRRDSSLYNRMLLRIFPEYFAAIPWQKTGLQISRTLPFGRPGVIARKAIGKLRRTIPLFDDHRDFTDYPSWIRSEPARSLFEETLTAADSPLCTYIDRTRVQKALRQHLGGANRAELLGRYLTLDVWLKYIRHRRSLSCP